MDSFTVACTSTPDAVHCAADYTSPGTRPRSAIATFSDLVSKPNQLMPNATSHDIARIVLLATGPHSLPTEIVRMIFQFVFNSCVDSRNVVINGNSDDPVSWLDEDPLSSSLFPYSLACVCLRWFRILRTIPIYWTRLVIAVDALSASLNTARTILEWAGDRPLKVIVTRHRGTSENKDSERAGIGRVMKFLRPHINRVWSLSFDVEHNSSIPALWRESGRARRLKALSLLSRSDSSPISQSSNWLPSGNGHQYDGRLKAPLLQQVTFSGYFLKSPLMAHPRLVNWFSHVTSLTICGDVASSGNTFSLFKFLSVIDVFSSIQELTVEDVHFDDNAPYPNFLTLKPTTLCLRRITGKTALRGILMRARVGSSRRTHTTIIKCDFDGLQESYPDSNLQFSSTSLTLVSMNPSATIEDLICRWNGENLTVIDCPRMSHSFLDRLHGEGAQTRLSRLKIVDCDSFNAGDVISLVQSRESRAAFVSLMGVSDDDRCTAVAELRVHGRGPPISVKRAKWLAEHVETFSWDTIAKDGLQYVWDEYAGTLMVSPSSSSSHQSTQLFTA